MTGGQPAPAVRSLPAPNPRFEPLEKCGNWLWLSDLEEWALALDAFGGLGGMACSLAPHFRLVHSLEPNPNARRLVADRAERWGRANVSVVAADLVALPYADASVSCIVARTESLGDLVAAPDAVALRECRRVLRGGGCLCIGFDNPYFAKHLVARLRRDASRDARHSAAQVARALVGAGFAEIQRYWVEPSLANPWIIVPASAEAAVGQERLKHWAPWRTVLRTAIARSPFRPLLYPAYLFVAYP